MSADKVTKSTIQLGTIMKIKSLLLASAAAMVTVSGAQAADAVIVEPEPAEYVRVCDAYGAGFFFIPGTETCMRFSGYVRTDYQDSEVETTSTNVTNSDTATTEDITRHWRTRARFDIDTRNETELGTLRALMRIQSDSADDDGTQSEVEVDKALITLAGFRAGIGDSLFNANFAIVNTEGIAGEDFNYGFSNAHIADYTYTIGDFHISGGIEVEDGDAAQNEISYLAKVEYTADHWLLGVVGERKDNRDVAYKVYGNIDISEFVPGGIIGGWYMGSDLDDDSATDDLTRLGIYDEVWGIGYQMNLTDDVEFIALHTQSTADGNGKIQSFTDPTSATGSNLVPTGDDQATTVGLNWYPVSGMKVFGTYTFGTTELQASLPVAGGGTESLTREVDTNTFVIGLRRSF